MKLSKEEQNRMDKLLQKPNLSPDDIRILKKLFQKQEK